MFGVLVKRGAVVVAAALLVGCASRSVEPSTTTSDGPVAKLVGSTVGRTAGGDPTAAGASMAGFGTALLGALPADGNLVISPYSVYAVLAMARAGAAGAVADELDAILESRTPGGVVSAVDSAAADAELHGQKQQPDDTEVVIDPANSLWVQDGAIKQHFLDTIAADYGAGVYLTDYAQPERARSAINDWVSDHTKTLIPQLIPAGVITPDTVLTMVNALYFAAQWGVVFEAQPSPLSFQLNSGTAVEAPAFGGTEHLDTATGDGWRSVTVPYKGWGVAMTFIVPDEGRFDSVQGKLDAKLIASAQNGVQATVNLTVPKFHIDYPSSLNDALLALGGKTLFSGDADWSGIADGAGLRVTDVVHQAVITTDEKGTVAAAATALAFAASASAPQTPIDVTIDRPFFFVIHDTVTGAPLFLGRVLDPTA